MAIRDVKCKYCGIKNVELLNSYGKIYVCKKNKCAVMYHKKNVK